MERIEEGSKDSIPNLKINYLKNNHYNDVANKCFCCEYAFQHRHRLNHNDNSKFCKYCPLDWCNSCSLFINKQCERYKEDGVYCQNNGRLDKELDWRKREYAKNIANLSERI